MAHHDPTVEDLLARLERERLDADRLYNAALTAVDGALHTVPALPAAPASPDTSRLAELNAGWKVAADSTPRETASLRGRFRGWIWRAVAPGFAAQERFNAALVDHLNRNARVQAELTQSVTALLETLRHELQTLVRFESLLVQSLQSITLYVDTKDRSLGGAEIRQRLALTEQRLLALKREVEVRTTSAASDVPSARSSSGEARPSGGEGPPAAFSGAVDSVSYVGFEDQFRGSQAEIRRRVEDYVPVFAGRTAVLDMGCGRGELLALLGENGIAARGVDGNAAMVELCRSRGLDADVGDALEFLQSLPDGSLDGLIAIQVVEHLAPGYLIKLLETAFHKLQPGSPIVLETINPACWMAFFETYIRDVTHRQPLHPDTLRYLVQAGGFSSVDVQFRAPVSAGDRLDRVEPLAGQPELLEVSRALNAHADKLNRLLFSFMDYAVIARR